MEISGLSLPHLEQWAFSWAIVLRLRPQALPLFLCFFKVDTGYRLVLHSASLPADFQRNQPGFLRLQRIRWYLEEFLRGFAVF